MAFFASWPDRRSLFIDTTDRKVAAAIALDVGESAPRSLAVVPAGVVVFEVFYPDAEEEDEDVGDLRVVPALDVVEELLCTLEDASDGETEPPAPGCTADALDDAENLIVCELAEGHAGKHRRLLASGIAMVWK